MKIIHILGNIIIHELGIQWDTYTYVYIYMYIVYKNIYIYLYLYL